LGSNHPDEASRKAEGGTAPDPVLARLDSWQKIGLAIAGLLTLIAQLWLAIQKDWQITAVTLLLAGIAIAIDIVFFRRRSKVDPRKQRFARWASIATLIGIPIASMIFLFAYSYLPRTKASGNTIAVSRFAGPALPAPYESCRPSAMLVHALGDVADRFHRIEVFEVPYTVDPERRWAGFWAKSHGWLDAADVIVYGDYNLAKSDEKLATADEITLNPRVDAVPKIPIADKVPPLYSWDFPRRTMPIAQLCGAAAGEQGSPDFIDDARGLALAVVGADLFAAQDYEGAKHAVEEAKVSLKGSACDNRGGRTPCRGVLAFYLANLDLRLGNFADAENEYRYAADHLESTAPLISLGELYIRRGRPKEGFESLDRAVRTDPASVAALATRALYERDYLRPREAAVDLDRALTQPATHFYDLSALSRALYQRGGKGDTDCGLAMLHRAIASPEFDRRTMLDTYVRYGIWLGHAKRSDEAAQIFSAALALNPYNIKANYAIGVALREKGLKPQAKAAFHRALFSPGFTDDDALDKANAANELRSLAESESEELEARAAALQSYGQAISVNGNAVYAMWDRGQLEDSLKQYDLAERDFKTAADLHPFDATLVSTYSLFLRQHGRADESIRYANTTRAVLRTRIPPDEAKQWSSQTCRYENMD
jgi:tetratricopeptide (TPR) repeat protein